MTSLPLPPHFDPIVRVVAKAFGISESEAREALAGIYRAGFTDGLDVRLDEALKQAAASLGISAPLPRLTTRGRGES